MRAAILSFILGFNYFVGAYFGVMNTIPAILLALSPVAILRHIQRIKYSTINEF